MTFADDLLAAKEGSLPMPLSRVDRGPVVLPVYAIRLDQLHALLDEIQELREQVPAPAPEQ